jgi:capsular polysaccharide biosynthesis protein
LNLILGVVLAGFVSFAAIFSAELLDDRVYSPRQLESMTGRTVWRRCRQTDESC